MEKDFAKETVELGDLGYWPEGSCFCIFFGATPISKKGEIRPASAVTVIGRVNEDLESLKTIPTGAKVILEKDKTG